MAHAHEHTQKHAKIIHRKPNTATCARIHRYKTMETTEIEMVPRDNLDDSPVANSPDANSPDNANLSDKINENQDDEENSQRKIPEKHSFPRISLSNTVSVLTPHLHKAASLGLIRTVHQTTAKELITKDEDKTSESKTNGGGGDDGGGGGDGDDGDGHKSPNSTAGGAVGRVFSTSRTPSVDSELSESVGDSDAASKMSLSLGSTGDTKRVRDWLPLISQIRSSLFSCSINANVPSLTLKTIGTRARHHRTIIDISLGGVLVVYCSQKYPLNSRKGCMLYEHTCYMSKTQFKSNFES